MIHALRLCTTELLHPHNCKGERANTARAASAPRRRRKPPQPLWPSMVKEAKDTEMAMAKAVEGSEHDLEPRKLEYSPSRKPRLAPDPPELGDTRVGSIALMAFCFVGLQVPRCPPSSWPCSAHAPSATLHTFSACLAPGHRALRTLLPLPAP